MVLSSGKATVPSEVFQRNPGLIGIQVGFIYVLPNLLTIYNTLVPGRWLKSLPRLLQSLGHGETALLRLLGAEAEAASTALLGAEAEVALLGRLLLHENGW